MHPILIEFNWREFLIRIPSYSFFLSLSTVLLIIISFIRIVSVGVSYKNTLIIITSLTSAAFVGARVLNILMENRGWETLTAFGFVNFSMLGGGIAASAAALVCTWVIKINIWRLADAMVPGLFTGIILSRIGCFLNGCCFGVPSNLPWAVEFPRMSMPHLHQLQKGLIPFFTSGTLPVHPTQIYEIIAACLILAAGFVIERRSCINGVSFLSTVLSYLVFRIIISPLKAVLTGALFSVLFYQKVNIILIVLCTSMLLLLISRGSQLFNIKNPH